MTFETTPKPPLGWIRR